MSESTPSDERLDSWKAIADYLQRDIATVRRWEKGLALPIHRVGGIGRSVFANTAEIDEWLNRAKPLLPVVEATVAPAQPRPSRRLLWTSVSVVAGAVVVAVMVSRGWPTEAPNLHIEVTAGGVFCASRRRRARSSRYPRRGAQRRHNELRR